MDFYKINLCNYIIYLLTLKRFALDGTQALFLSALMLWLSLICYLPSTSSTVPISTNRMWQLAFKAQAVKVACLVHLKWMFFCLNLSKQNHQASIKLHQRAFNANPRLTCSANRWCYGANKSRSVGTAQRLWATKIQWVAQKARPSSAGKKHTGTYW